MLTTMGTVGSCLCFFLFIKINLVTGQSLPQEELFNITTCTLNSVNLNCDNDDMIAFQSAHFYYHATCESTCCQYSSDHETVGASQQDIADIRGQCSGQNSCSLDVDDVRTFVSGVKPPSYAILYYHCIQTTEPNVAFKLSCSAEPQTTCIDCGTPNSIPNGEITLDNGNTSSGSLATVSCSNGYETDNATLICLETGQWTNTTCSPKDCGEPYTIPNGTITAAVDGSTTFGAKANVTCDPGYQMTGYCNRSTEFQCGDGTCIDMEKRCDSFPHCPNELDELLCPNVISCPNGQKLCDVTCVNEQVTCEESEASVVETDAGTVSCLVTGTWEKVICSAKDCGTPTVIENGTITLTEDDQTTYMSTADVTSDTGFTPSIALISCQAEGSWENGTCNDCGVPMVPNGTVTLTKPGESTVGSTADIECSAGFTSSVSSITCLTSGQWENAFCDINDCGTPTDIENGTITLTKDGQTTYMSTADVTCDAGFTPSVALISCQADGSWENGACNIIDCGEPYAILHGTVTKLVSGITSFGAKANVTCNPGYQVKKNEISCPEGVTCEDGGTSVAETGSGTISCLAIGKWEKVQCSAKDTAQNETGDSLTLPVIILACSVASVVSIALTLVVLFIVRKYKRAKPNTPTSPPEHVVYYNTGVRENLDIREADINQYERINETSASETAYSTLDVNVSTNQRTVIDCL